MVEPRTPPSRSIPCRGTPALTRQDVSGSGSASGRPRNLLYDRCMRRVGSVALVLLALAVFAAAGYVVVHQTRVAAGRPHARPLPSASPRAAPGDPTTSRHRGRPRRPDRNPSATPVPPVVAFLGDDWTSGAGASPTSKRFTTLVCAQLGLRSQFRRARQRVRQAGPLRRRLRQPGRHGRRYNRETLEVKCKGKSIADVLDMPIEMRSGSSTRSPSSAGGCRHCTMWVWTTCGWGSRRPRSPAARHNG